MKIITTFFLIFLFLNHTVISQEEEKDYHLCDNLKNEKKDGFDVYDMTDVDKKINKQPLFGDETYLDNLNSDTYDEHHNNLNNCNESSESIDIGNEINLFKLNEILRARSSVKKDLSSIKYINLRKREKINVDDTIRNLTTRKSQDVENKHYINNYRLIGLGKRSLNFRCIGNLCDQTPTVDIMAIKKKKKDLNFIQFGKKLLRNTNSKVNSNKVRFYSDPIILESDNTKIKRRFSTITEPIHYFF